MPKKAQASNDVAVDVLGPLRLRMDGEAVTISAKQQRAIVETLALHAPRAVGTTALVDAVWGDDPPTSASRSLQSQISRLRRILGDGLVVGNTTDGYQLRCDVGVIDLHRFTRLLDESEAEAIPDRIPMLEQALKLWRDDPLPNLADTSAARGSLVALWERRSAAEEDLAEALVWSGRATTAIARLEPMVDAMPLRERRWVLLIDATLAADRTADALRAYQRARHALVDELGVEPGAALKAAEARALQGAPPLPPRRRASSGGTLRDAFGVVTVLFTDIEGSTPFWQHHPDAMAVAVATQQQVLSSTMVRHGGTVFAHSGDGIGVVFARPDDAVTAAIDAQRELASIRWPKDTPLRVRIGMHTGFAERADGNYFGPTVNTATRVADAAHGGQILLSGATFALVHDHQDVLVRLGPHTLRGFDSPVDFFQVGTEAFAPLRAADSGPTGLPAARTPIFGRIELIGRIRGLLVDHRIVTLFGTGGSGKTRVAVEAAREGKASYTGTYFVALGSVAVPEDVPAFVAAELGLHVSTTDSPVDVICRFFATGAPLVVLDNCEHVLDAVADVVDDIAQIVGEWRVIATSREALGLEDEQLVPVSPLGAGDPESPAVEMFCDRARATRSDFTLDEVSAPWVVSLCQALDGLPLAIELAAARIGVVSVEELHAMLDDRFTLLSGGRRRRSRSQALEATVAWSYDLLDENVQLFFRSLGMFDADFDLDAAAAVAGVDRVTALDSLDELAAKSLLVVSHGGDGTTYRLLETLRAYAAARMDELEERRDLRDRHLDHVLDRVRPVVDAYFPTIEALVAGGVLIDELAHARRWALEQGRSEDATRLTIASVQMSGLLALGRGLRLDDGIRPPNPSDRLAVQLEVTQLVRHTLDCDFHLAYEVADRLAAASDSVTAALGETMAAYYEADGARTRTPRALELADAVPDSDPDRAGIMTFAVFADSVTHLARGDIEAAYEVCRRHMEQLVPPLNHAAAGVVGQLASTAVVLGRSGEAVRWLDAFPDVERVVMMSLPSIRAVALAELGRVDEARLVADRFANRVRGANIPLTAKTAGLANAAIAIAAGDDATARDLLDQPTAGRSIAHYLLCAHLLCRVDDSLDLLSVYRERVRVDNEERRRRVPSPQRPRNHEETTFPDTGQQPATIRTS